MMVQEEEPVKLIQVIFQVIGLALQTLGWYLLGYALAFLVLFGFLLGAAGCLYGFCVFITM